MDEELITTTIQFPKELYRRIKEKADEEDRSFGYIIRKAAETFIPPKGAEQEKKADKKK